jgi:uncharacterized protein
MRGLALYGVLLVNVVTAFRISLFHWLTSFHADRSPVNRVADDVVAFFFEQKAMVVFSLLFGVGMAIVAERARARGVAIVAFFARRYALLGVIGVVHLVLVWNGDILTQYALVALALTPVVVLRPRPAILLTISAVLLLVWSSPWPLVPRAFPSPASMAAHGAFAERVYGQGTFGEVHALRVHELRVFIAPLLVSVAPRTAALFVLGLWVHASSIVTRQRRWLVFYVAFALAAGGALSAAEILWAEGVVDLRRSGDAIGNAGSLLLGTGYAALFLLVFQAPRLRRVLLRVAPVGRMALTNYLTQSIVSVALFYGVGLGLMGRIGSAAASALATVIFVAQCAFSTWWLRRHAFGPVEWAWRSLTYGLDAVKPRA